MAPSLMKGTELWVNQLPSSQFGVRDSNQTAVVRKEKKTHTSLRDVNERNHERVTSSSPPASLCVCVCRVVVGYRDRHLT